MSRAALIMLIILFAVLGLNICSSSQTTSKTPAPSPSDPPLRAPFPGLYTPALIEVAHQTFSGYDFVLSAHPPLNSTRDPVNGHANRELRGPLQIIDVYNPVNHTCDEFRSPDLTNCIVMVRCGPCSLNLERTQSHFDTAKALIFNEEEQPLPLLNGGQTPALTLSAVAFSELSEFVSEEASVWALPSPNDLSLINFLVILLIRPLLVLSVLLILFFFSVRRQHKHRRVSPEALQTLPTRFWQPNALNQWQQSRCLICLEDFEAGCEITVLPCQHEFHRCCVSRWLVTRRGACPLCMQDILHEQVPLLSA